MIQNKILFILLGILCVFTGCSTDGKPEKNIGSWVPYLVSENDSVMYYDRTRITKVRPKIIQVWTKITYSKEMKDKHTQYRKDNSLPLDGWEKLDHVINFEELDCVYMTRKRMEKIYYSDKDEILQKFDYNHPKITNILENSSDQVLLDKVCLKN